LSSWWEGVVTEKNEKDETTLKVHFPGLHCHLVSRSCHDCPRTKLSNLSSYCKMLAAGQGETSTVRAWNLRTTRSWKDGKWVEWSSSRGNNTSEQV